MDEPRTVTLVTRNETPSLVFQAAVTAFAFYYLRHPECVDEWKAALTRRWNRFVHRVSIWQTEMAIDSLPETDDPKV